MIFPYSIANISLKSNYVYRIYLPVVFIRRDDSNWGPEFPEEGLIEFKIAVSNLRGEVIWESRDPKSKWDGTYYERQVPSGYYVWEVSYFESQTNENIRVRGNLMVF